MPLSARRLLLLALALGSACGPDDGLHGQEGTDTSGSESGASIGSLSVGSTSLTGATTTSTDTSTSPTGATLDGTADSTSESTSDASSSSTGVPTDCGNGRLDEGEECDDHNTIDGDGCNADCLPGGQEMWTVVIDGGSQHSDRANAVAIDADDDVYVAGWAGTAANYDAFVVKLDDDGQLQWTDTYSGGMPQYTEGYYGVAVLPNQSIVVAGWHTSDAGNTEAMVRCYSEDGAVLWTYFEPDIGASVGLSVAVDSFGDAVVAGSAHDPIDGAVREWVGTFNSDGDVLSNLRIALPYDLVSLAFAVDSSDALIFAGFGGPAMVSKRDADGNELWSYIDLAIGVYAMGLATASDDGILVGGQGPMNSAYFAHHPADGIDPDWTDAWAGNYGGSAWTNGVAVDSTDRTLWVGAETTAMSAYYIFARKLDTDHSVAWTHEVMGLPGSGDAATAVAVDSLDQPVVVGVQRGADGDDDVWIRKLTQ